MRFGPWAASAAIGLISVAAPASATGLICFTRAYSAAHLAEQPAQTVEAISVAFDRTLGDSDVAEVRARFRDSRTPYGATLICQSDGIGFLTPSGLPPRARHCFVECDGGSFSYWAPEPGVLLIKTRGGFAVGPTCGDGDGEGRWVTDAGAAETTYRLTAAPLASCRGG